MTRALLFLLLASCGASEARRDFDSNAVIDAHTHFWNPQRPIPTGRARAVPFSNGKVVLPDDYLAPAKSAGVTGTIVVEASGWLEDNEWVLDLARAHPVILGVIGNLNEVLGTPRFDAAFERLCGNPLFRGIRLARAEDLARPEWRAHLQALSDKGLTVDLNANGPAALRAAAANAGLFPKLKIVLDHAAYIEFKGAPRPEWEEAIRNAARIPNIYCKVSRIQEQAGMKPAPADVEPYRPVLDLLWDSFGEDRLFFGSNWPLSDSAGSLNDAVRIARAYVGSRGAEALEKFFHRNATRVYGLKPRTLQ
jgi:L-fuconolactonase